MGKVRALVSQLAKMEAVALIDGGCDTTLLGTGWYILEYTGEYANIVGFDEFVARKAGLPIVTGITKIELPDRKGFILLRSNESVYNKGSRTTLLSEFQLRDRGCIVDNTFKGHWGADYKPGTQRIETPDDDGKDSYVIPLQLVRAALMTMPISVPTEHDLEKLPIMDITSPGLWIPSDHNETGFGFSFADTSFDSMRAVQKSTLQHPMEAPSDDTFYNSQSTSDVPSDDTFYDSQSTSDAFPPDDPIFYDACDDLDSRVLHLSLDYDKAMASTTVDAFLTQLDYSELRGDQEEFDTFAYVSRAAIQDQAAKYVEYLGYRPIDIVRKTLEKTSQLATTILRFPMRRHIKSRFPHLNRNRLRETVATDTYFANVRAIGGATCAQVFYGLQSHMINVYWMKTESEMPDIY
jgi:hypothetical protein